MRMKIQKGDMSQTPQRSPVEGDMRIWTTKYVARNCELKKTKTKKKPLQEI